MASPRVRPNPNPAEPHINPHPSLLIHNTSLLDAGWTYRCRTSGVRLALTGNGQTIGESDLQPDGGDPIFRP
jgi:hypothetical protein